MTQAYSDPTRETDPHALPDIEVFYMDAAEFAAADDGSWMQEAMADDNQTHGYYPDGLPLTRHDAAKAHEGWYWWACFPGCLPDGEPNGPFATEAEALADAQDY